MWNLLPVLNQCSFMGSISFWGAVFKMFYLFSVFRSLIMMSLGMCFFGLILCVFCSVFWIFKIFCQILGIFSHYFSIVFQSISSPYFHFSFYDSIYTNTSYFLLSHTSLKLCSFFKPYFLSIAQNVSILSVLQFTDSTFHHIYFTIKLVQ